jgi:hypothetical protein
MCDVGAYRRATTRMELGGVHVEYQSGGGNAWDSFASRDAAESDRPKRSAVDPRRTRPLSMRDNT